MFCPIPAKRLCNPFHHEVYHMLMLLSRVRPSPSRGHLTCTASCTGNGQTMKEPTTWYYTNYLITIVTYFVGYDKARFPLYQKWRGNNDDDQYPTASADISDEHRQLGVMEI